MQITQTVGDTQRIETGVITFQRYSYVTIVKMLPGHSHEYHRTSSPSSSSSSSNFRTNGNDNDNEDTYRSVQHVELKHQQDGSLEGVAIQIEQSHNTDGRIERRRTCMQACGVRRRTMILYPETSSSLSTDMFPSDSSCPYYRPNSTPTFT